MLKFQIRKKKGVIIPLSIYSNLLPYSILEFVGGELNLQTKHTK